MSKLDDILETLTPNSWSEEQEKARGQLLELFTESMQKSGIRSDQIEWVLKKLEEL